jgi:dipeptidyl aminopeptidase/acylaminoacyl peptidase
VEALNDEQGRHAHSAAYGTWASPISAQRIAAGARPLSAPRVVGSDICWLEGLPAEGGRVVVVRWSPGSAPRVVTPAPFNVRSRVHEYGGGAYAVDADTIYFSNFADNLVYAQHGDAAPLALTEDSALRFADFEIDKPRQRLIAVCEDHRRVGTEPENRLVALSTAGCGDPVTLASGFDFCAAPRLSPDGREIAWISWNHPDMPWTATALWRAGIGDDGRLVDPGIVVDGRDADSPGRGGESLVQPMWSPVGELFVAADRSGWWNLYRVDGPSLVPVCLMQAEFASPAWQFAQSMAGFDAGSELIATCITDGISRLVGIDVARGEQRTIATPYTDIQELRVGGGIAVMLAASPTLPTQVVRLDLATGQTTVLAQAVAEVPDQSQLAIAQTIAYASTGGRIAHAFLYLPRNGDTRAPDGERPPLIVTSHGGPTSMSTGSLRLSMQFWTSRGFAVLDVNYGGSSGYGRAYRDLLAGQWGIVDVDDCIAGARHLAEQGLVDPQRMAIRGGSASGFTTLCALTFHRVFSAGASHYGVSDLAALDADTHKFESRYTTGLVASAADRERVYRERSPIHHTDRLSCPMIFFQGLDDRVVPPSQSQAMVDALAARGVPVAYLSFEGEGHGFRRAETIRRALEAELSFYGQVFGFEPAGDIEPVAIQGLSPGRSG